MIPNNSIRLNVVVSITQKMLFQDLEVDSLKEIYVDGFFSPEKIAKFKENSLSLPSTFSVDCVEITDNFVPFFQIGDTFFNLVSIWEFHYNEKETALTIICADGMIHTLDKEGILATFSQESLRFLPINLQNKLSPLFKVC